MRYVIHISTTSFQIQNTKHIIKAITRACCIAPKEQQQSGVHIVYGYGFDRDPVLFEKRYTPRATFTELKLNRRYAYICAHTRIHVPQHLICWWLSSCSDITPSTHPFIHTCTRYDIGIYIYIYVSAATSDFGLLNVPCYYQNTAAQFTQL